MTLFVNPAEPQRRCSGARRFAFCGRGPSSNGVEFITPALAVGRDTGHSRDALDVEPLDEIGAVDSLQVAYQAVWLDERGNPGR